MDLGSLAPVLLSSVMVHEHQQVRFKVKIIFMFKIVCPSIQSEGMEAMDLSVKALVPVYIFAEFCPSGNHQEAKMKPWDVFCRQCDRMFP